MEQTVTRTETRKKVVRPESTTMEYEVFLRTHRKLYQKILWFILTVFFVAIGVYSMLGGPNPFLP